VKKVLLAVVALGVVFSLATDTGHNQELQENKTETKSRDLQVVIAADRETYKPQDKIRLDVKLVNNNAVKDIFIYGTLQFGVRASFTLFRRDAKGEEVPTRLINDAWELPPKRDEVSAFVKLLPSHFLGKTYKSTIHMQHMEKPGKYSMWVEYHCPISASDVVVSPFWSKESGAIKSNVVSIRVVR
jgi:hypothetical protein